ncbi:hypothetical protein K504DRAFT_451851 [Pleomassaria siparia CBS 279.74]|uniref:Arrestin-like N-terminal domain-containing protein n=1 Tax=Pleomassaria siparia CBS 279.74 TaxID=1314801 RepID=A0A6G1JSY2_9PLEO|nr:hypothetical protein K504DRAFT_451851 [Pleomassaria siparia CBS 279.74]
MPCAWVLDTRVVSIHLPEDRTCKNIAKDGKCHCHVRTGGDTLEGEISFQLALNIESTIDVCFEGLSRTWLPNENDYNEPFKNENHFLQQVESIKVPPHSEDASRAWPETRTVSFKFKIPKTLPVAASVPDLDPRPQELHPSVAVGHVHRDGTDSYMQPLIMYRLVASIRTKGMEPERPRVGIVRKIKIMPTTHRPPPVYLSTFEQEYSLEATSKLRKHFYGHSEGLLEFAAEEPEPIDISSHDPRSSTRIVLRASFRPDKAVSRGTIEPYNWTFSVRTRLQRRVFYATEPLTREPTLKIFRTSSYIGLRTEILQTEEREYTELTWRNDHTSSNGTIVMRDENECPWLVTIPVVLTSNHNLIPSFSSATAALRYSVILDIRSSRPWSSHATLELPLQVFSRSRASSEHRPSSGDDFHSHISHMTDEECEENVIEELMTRPPEYRRWAF